MRRPPVAFRNSSVGTIGKQNVLKQFSVAILKTVTKHCRPAFYPFCMHTEDFNQNVRLQYWERVANAGKHIVLRHGRQKACRSCDFIGNGLD